jgi:hypothetical protein
MTLEGCFRGRLPHQCKDSGIDSRYDTRTGVSAWIPVCIVWGRVASLCSLWGNDFSSFDVFGSWGGQNVQSPHDVWHILGGRTRHVVCVMTRVLEICVIVMITHIHLLVLCVIFVCDSNVGHLTGSVRRQRVWWWGVFMGKHSGCVVDGCLLERPDGEEEMPGSV